MAIRHSDSNKDPGPDPWDIDEEELARALETPGDSRTEIYDVSGNLAIIVLRGEEARRDFDAEVRRDLGMSAEEFAHRYWAGEFDEWDSKVVPLAFQLNTLGYGEQ